jgi:glycosyltransferase involved in cell wall biosynthesis
MVFQKMRTKTKLVFVISDLRVGGSSQVVFDLIKHVDKEAFAVSLIVFFNGLPMRYKSLLNNPDIDIFFLGKKRMVDLPFFLRLKKLIRSINPDAISCHLSSVFYLNFVVNYKITKVFYTIHAEPSFDLPKIYRLWLHHSIKNNRIKLIGCCPYIARQARKLYHTDCFSIQNGVEPPSFVRPFADREYDFLCVGRFTRVKRFTDLLAAFRIVHESLPNSKLALCGYGEEKESLLAQIKALELRDCIDIFDDKKNPDELYNSSKIFCLFSEREGCPITILEAMSYGLACIVTKVGGNPDLVKDGVTGVLVDVGDTNAQAAAMAALLKDQERIVDYHFAALKESKNNTSELMAKHYESLFL